MLVCQGWTRRAINSGTKGETDDGVVARQRQIPHKE
jgi:hypothetical protein